MPPWWSERVLERPPPIPVPSHHHQCERRRQGLPSRDTRPPGVVPTITQGARRPLDAVEHRCHRRGHRHHARTCLRVPNAKLTGRAVHVVPTQRENLRMAASGEHQQPDGRNRRRPHRAVRLRFAQCTAQAPVLLGRQEPLARMLLVAAHGAARIASRGNELHASARWNMLEATLTAALAVQGLSRSP